MKTKANRIWSLGVALLWAAASAAAVLPGPSWDGLRTAPGGDDWMFLKGPGGKGLGRVRTYRGPYVETLVVSNAADSLVIDPRAAFAAGTAEIHVYLPDLDGAPLSGNRSVVSRLAWEGPRGMRIRDILFARRPDGTEWHSGHVFRANSRRRRVSEGTFDVPECTKAYHRIDILSPGDPREADGSFRLWTVETGDWAELGTRRPARAGEPKLTFAASFEKGLSADVAAGDGTPAKANGVELVEGRAGKGVRFRRSAQSDLAWPVAGNLDPARGTLAFWLKREWGDDAKAWRTLFWCPSGANAKGDGSMKFWNLGETVRLDRNDLDGWEQYIRPDWETLGGGWHHYAITWDDAATTLYVDGAPVPQSANEKLRDAYSPMRSALEPVNLHEFARDPSSFALFHLGSQGGGYSQDGVFDDVKAWSEAMTADEVRALAAREGAATAAPPLKMNEGANRYEAPAAAVPGRVGGLRLVTRIRPAADALGPDRLSVAGPLATNVLDGVAYLETGKMRDDRFAVRLAVDVAKPFCVIEVDYPDDRPRQMEIVVQRAKEAFNDYALETGVFCDGATGKMRTESYVYWTSAADVAMIVSAIAPDAPGAVAEIRVYEPAEARLPAAVSDAALAGLGPTPRRRFANYWEDPAVLYDFGTDWRRREGFAEMADRLAAYMKFCGQDTLAFPAAFYQGRIGKGTYDIRNLPVGFLEGLLTRFDALGLSVVPTVNQQTVPTPDGLVTRQSMADGSLHATSVSIHATGLPNWGGWHGTPPAFNLAHRDTLTAFVRLVREIAEEGKAHPSFKGVALHLPVYNPLWFGTIDAGYNDYCIDAFEKATGIKVPCDRSDPLRGKAYAAWLKANAYDAWVGWRCDVVTAFYRRLAKTLAAARPDLRLWLNAIPQWTDDPKRLLDPAETRRLLLEAGFDAEKIAANVPGAVVGLTGLPAWWWRFGAHDARTQGLTGLEKATVKTWSSAPARFALLRGAGAAWGHFHDIYRETSVGRNRTGTRVLSNGWLDEVGWRVSTEHPAGAEALAPFAGALAGSDAQVLSCGGFLIGTLGIEPELAAWMREYRKLPAVPFRDVPAPAGWVRRTAECDGRRWTYSLKTSAPYTLEVTSRAL